MDNVVSQQIQLLSKSMKLATFATYEQTVREANESQLSYDEFLLRLLDKEATNRKYNKLLRLKRMAKFPYEKSFEEFDFTRLKHVDQAFLMQLSACDYIAAKENVLLIGNPGTGNYRKF